MKTKKVMLILCCVSLVLVVKSEKILGNEKGDHYSWRVLSLFFYSLSSFPFICAAFIAASILRCKRTNKIGFNIFIVFLIIPDALMNGVNFFCGIIQRNQSTSGISCTILLSSGYAYYYANLYLNAVVASKIYELMVRTRRGLRVDPPSFRSVCTQTALAYLWSGFICVWHFSGESWALADLDPSVACKLNFGSPKNGFFSEVASKVINYVLFLLPFLYVTYIGYQIRRQKLIPTSGRTRSISLYFMRILVVFYCCYLPVLAVVIVQTRVENRIVIFWSVQIYSFLIQSQCMVTLYFVMKKDDIRDAIKKSIPSFEKLQKFYKRDIISDTSIDTHPEQEISISVNGNEVLA
mmetsp:Transcript_53171/g.64053  ORF Transcript_53171/g.64053 Transcript_53171/m.64053 type:complete len:351 (-) Transcript_53171:35-1087(-)